MTRQYLSVGAMFTGGKEQEFSQCFDSVQWHKTPHELSDSAAKAIAMSCLHLKVNAYEVADYYDFEVKPGLLPDGIGLLGFSIKDPSGQIAKVYMADLGTEIRTLCVDKVEAAQ